MDTALYDISDSYVYSSSTSSLESSGSEYDPRAVHKSQRKKANQKGKCNGAGKCKAKTSEFHGHNVVSVPFACQFSTKNNWPLH
jgi:hypothetical protein